MVRVVVEVEDVYSPYFEDGCELQLRDVIVIWTPANGGGVAALQDADITLEVKEVLS